MDINPWKLTRGSWKESHPIGADVEQFIRENCQWSLYFRRDPMFKCQDHWDFATESRKAAIASCDRCRGFGVKTTPQIVPARFSFGKAAISGNEGDIKVLPGYIENFNAAVDFPREVYPQLEDLVCICEWDVDSQLLNRPTPRVLRINSTYIIKQINPHFERQVSWFNCAIEGYDIEGKLMTDIVPYLTDLEIIGETWPQTYL